MDKVLYFGNFNCKNGFASIQRAIGICSLFFKNGYESYIFSEECDEQIANDKLLLNKKINIVNVECRNTKNKYFSFAFWKKIMDKYSDAKVIVLYDFPSFITPKIIKYAKKHSIKVIGDITEWFGLISWNVTINFVKRIDTFIRMRILIKKYDCLIVVSEYLKKHLKTKKPILKVYPLMDYANDKLNNSLKNKKIKNETINLIYTGNCGRKKDDLLSLIKILNATSFSSKLIVAGNISNKYLNKLQKNEYWTKHTEYLGNLTHSKCIELVLASDYQVIYRKNIRSNNAGFPTKFAETISLGKRIISTSFSDIAYVNEKLDNIIISYDVNEAARQLDRHFLNNCNSTRLIDSSMFFESAYYVPFLNFIDKII